MSELDLALVPIQQYTKFEVHSLNLSKGIEWKLKLGHMTYDLKSSIYELDTSWGNEAT
jgi:hypothetical protein